MDTVCCRLLAAKRKIYGQYPLSENFYNRISIRQREKPGRSRSILYRKQSPRHHQPGNIRQGAGPPKKEKSARFRAVQIPVDEENDLRKVWRNIRPLAKIKIVRKNRVMKYEKLAEYSNTKFRRITGVKRATFDKMVEILQKGYAEKHRRRGRTPKLSIEDLLLATLEYLREYRTYAHIAASYGIAESNIYRGIKWVEDTLIRDGTFSLPGRKAPLKSDAEYEVILVDATESPIERPKKSKSDTIPERKSGTH